MHVQSISKLNRCDDFLGQFAARAPKYPFLSYTFFAKSIFVFRQGWNEIKLLAGVNLERKGNEGMPEITSIMVSELEGDIWWIYEKGTKQWIKKYSWQYEDFLWFHFFTHISVTQRRRNIYSFSSISKSTRSTKWKLFVWIKPTLIDVNLSHHRERINN